MMTWRYVTPDDFPLLARWLAAPHVARWWHHETSAQAVERDFGPSARHAEPNEDLLAFLDGSPLGLLQRSFLHDYPEYLTELASITVVPARAMTIDYLIGDAANVGHGIGTDMIRSALEQLWADHNDAECVIVAVHADNIASWRALEKAGLTRVGSGAIEPDNPIDDRRHHVYRVDRPTGLPICRSRSTGRPDVPCLRAPSASVTSRSRSPSSGVRCFADERIHRPGKGLPTRVTPAG